MSALTNEEIGTLAMYNSERARGILHSYDWTVKMRELQERFDKETEVLMHRAVTSLRPNTDET